MQQSLVISSVSAFLTMTCAQCVNRLWTTVPGPYKTIIWGRRNMRYGMKFLTASAVASLFLSGSVFACNNPVDEPWGPSQLGPDAQVSVATYITAQKLIDAANLGKTDNCTLLGH